MSISKRMLPTLWAACLLTPGLAAAQSPAARVDGLRKTLERTLRAGEVPALLKKELVVPDAGAGRPAYASSLHWFRLADRRMVGIHIIRSDRPARQALRVFVVDLQGRLRALIHDAPQSRWAPFGTRFRIAGTANMLARGRNWIAGRVRGARSTIRSVAFRLRVEPEGRGWPLGKGVMTVGTIDFPRARVRGLLAINGRWHRIDSRGPVVVQTGDALSEYASFLTVPDPRSPGVPDVMVASSRAADLRAVGGLLPKKNDVSYSRWLGLKNDIPHVLALNVGPFADANRVVAFPSLLKSIRFERVLSSLDHRLLGVDTTFFVARVLLDAPGGLAPWLWTRRQRYRVLVVGDARGPHFRRLLRLDSRTGLAGRLTRLRRP